MKWIILITVLLGIIVVVTFPRKKQVTLMGGPAQGTGNVWKIEWVTTNADWGKISNYHIGTNVDQEALLAWVTKLRNKAFESGVAAGASVKVLYPEQSTNWEFIYSAALTNFPQYKP